MLPAVPAWEPVLLPAEAAAGSWPPELVAEVERTAAERGLPPVRWPRAGASPELAARAATFAAASGRVVAFSLAALRQAFAAGRDLSLPDNVVLAAAACELHPRAVLKGVESRAVSERLEAATRSAIQQGVVRVPAVAAGGRVFHGDEGVEEAAAALAGP